MAQEKTTMETTTIEISYLNKPEWHDFQKSTRVYTQKTLNAYADLPSQNNAITNYEMHYFRKGIEIPFDSLVKIDISKILVSSLNDLMKLTAQVQNLRDSIKVISVEVTGSIVREKAEVKKENYIYKVFVE